MTLIREWIPSPSYHGRNINSLRIGVFHTAQGARTIEDLGGFFQNPANQVSSHVGADDQPGRIGEYVTQGNAAWTQAYYNNEAISLELCGFAEWSRSVWMNNHHNMLENAAAWAAEESARFGIPLTILNDAQSQGNSRGFTQHINLGPSGSGHVDCGSGFPMDHVMYLAHGNAGRVSTYQEDIVMQLVFDKGDPEHAPACSISIPNEYADGQHKLRFSAKDTTALRVDTPEGKRDVSVEYLGAQSVDIGKGWDAVIVKRDSGESPVSVAFSER